jgi:hypothetical protein
MMGLSVRWQNHIEGWQNSGLSQAAYCRQQGLSAKTFYGRLHYYRTTGAAHSQPLIPVRVQPAPLTPGVIVLCHVQGHRLELPATVSPGWLAEVLRCLG